MLVAPDDIEPGPRVLRLIRGVRALHRAHARGTLADPAAERGVALARLDQAFLGELLVRLVAAQQHDVAARTDRTDGRAVGTHRRGDRLHVEIVRDYHAAITEAVPQQPGDHLVRQCRG